MRLDHIAYRVADRKRAAQFFIDALGYRIQEEFPIEFDDGTQANCIALTPSEKKAGTTLEAFTIAPYMTWNAGNENHEFHIPPEIFVSDGEPGSLIDKWVKERGGIGGVHHLAYQVDDVEAKMKEWKEKGYAEFASESPLVCLDPPLTQVFTKPSNLTGVVYEFIKRTTHGFCKSNVKNLMVASTK